MSSAKGHEQSQDLILSSPGIGKLRLTQVPGHGGRYVTLRGWEIAGRDLINAVRGSYVAGAHEHKLSTRDTFARSIIWIRA